MRKTTLTVATATLAIAGAIFSGVSGAQAESVGGGTWYHGVRVGGEYGSGGAVLSEYYHIDRTHRATACNGNGKCDRTGWTSKGFWARARLNGATDSGNVAYWDVK